MEAIADEGLLSLSLAIGSRDQKNEKRKRKMVNFDSPLNSYEGKIFNLLRLREGMLKQDKKLKRVVEEDGKGLHLIHLLLLTAAAVDEDNAAAALENLKELYQTVSLTGDSVQRVMAYFADGLTARLLTRKSPFFDMIMKEPTAEEEFTAFTCLYRISPYYQFAHFTANQAILEMYEKEYQENNTTALHVIDFDISYGFQWPSLIQSLSEKASGNNRISLRISGYGRSLEELQETESRLVSFAKGFKNLVFEFQGVLTSGSNFILSNLRKKKNETLAVNLCIHDSNTTSDSLVMFSNSLSSVHSLKPSIATLVEQQTGRITSKSFLSRFMESLHYYAAMFDSLDDCLPLDSSERLSIERSHLGKDIKNMLNYNKAEYDSCSKGETWKGRMERHGFEGVKLSSKCLIQAKLLLRIRNTHYSPFFSEGEGGGFRVFEKDEGKTLCLGWQDRGLLSVSAWHCV